MERIEEKRAEWTPNKMMRVTRTKRRINDKPVYSMAKYLCTSVSPVPLSYSILLLVNGGSCATAIRGLIGTETDNGAATGERRQLSGGMVTGRGCKAEPLQPTDS